MIRIQLPCFGRSRTARARSEGPGESQGDRAPRTGENREMGQDRRSAGSGWLLHDGRHGESNPSSRLSAPVGAAIVHRSDSFHIPFNAYPLY